jgi:hypothetical protein
MQQQSVNRGATAMLELRGYEANTALDVYVSTQPLDATLKLSLESQGYVQRRNIVLSDGQTVTGWINV